MNNFHKKKLQARIIFILMNLIVPTLRCLSQLFEHFFLLDLQSATSYTSISSGGQSSPQVQYYGSRRSSVHSNTEPQEVADANVKFVRDTSRIWYKPNISREQGKSWIRTPTSSHPSTHKLFFIFYLLYINILFLSGRIYAKYIRNYDRKCNSCSHLQTLFINNSCNVLLFK